MQSVNQLLADETIRHAEYLQRYSTGVITKMLRVLNQSDQRMFAELQRLLADTDASNFSMARLESMIASVRSMSSAAYTQIGQDLSAELISFSEYEASYQSMVLDEYTPVGVSVAAVSGPQVYAAAMARPFQGVLLRNVWDDLDRKHMAKIQQKIMLGYTEGKTTDQIIREIKGTRAQKYKDGIVNKDRAEVATVVRTAIGHTAAVAREEADKANLHIIKAYKWLSTLDGRTSPPCRVRDGKLYDAETKKPIGHSYSWGSAPGQFHWQCRSTYTRVLKSNEELGIDVPEIVMVGSTRASMNGQVPAETTYSAWFKKQPASVQDDIVGPERGRLMRIGKLPFDELYDARGRYLTLDEIRQRDAAAFKKAGL